MGILTLFLGLYLAIGFIYAVYLVYIGSSSIWWIPVNTLGGPIAIIYVVFKTKNEEYFK